VLDDKFQRGNDRGTARIAGGCGAKCDGTAIGNPAENEKAEQWRWWRKNTRRTFLQSCLPALSLYYFLEFLKQTILSTEISRRMGLSDG